MMNVENISTNAEQKPILSPKTDISTEVATDIQADKAIKKARALLSLQKKTNLYMFITICYYLLLEIVLMYVLLI